MHVFTVRAPPFVGGDAPRQRDDVDTVTRLAGPFPRRVFVVNDPLKAVHGRFVELLREQIILKRPRTGVGADAHVHQISIRG